LGGGINWSVFFGISKVVFVTTRTKLLCSFLKNILKAVSVEIEKEHKRYLEELWVEK
jgi:hypothetical protein